MNDTFTFLRPNFTTKIADYLSKGFKVNVYSVEKQGLIQLIEDLRQACSNNTHFISLNMNSHAHNFESYLLALGDALGLKVAPENMRMALIDYLDQHPNRNIQLCLENFDQLSEKSINNQKVDRQGYNIDFLNHLNSFGNNPRIALLFTSTHQLNTQELYIGGERVRGSKIDVKYREALPELDFAEIAAYLQKICPAANDLFQQNHLPAFCNVLIPEIARQGDPTDFMHFIADRIPHTPEIKVNEFQKYLTAWKKTYARENMPSTEIRLSNLGQLTKQWANWALRLVGIGQNLSLVHKRIIALCAVLLPIIWAIFRWWEWVTSFF